MIEATGIRVRAALRSEVDQLAAIELAAGRLFPAERIPQPDHTHPVAELVRAVQAGWLFVAEVEGEVVGFASCSRHGDRVHLDEVSVHPHHGRKGYGRALVTRVVDEAREQSLAGVSLTTFSDIEWNGPFYASMGFSEVPETDLDERLSAALADERGQGMTKRIAMVCLIEKEEGQ